MWINLKMEFRLRIMRLMAINLLCNKSWRFVKKLQILVEKRRNYITPPPPLSHVVLLLTVLHLSEEIQQNWSKYLRLKYMLHFPSFFFNVLLTVHHAMIFGNCPTWRTNSFQCIYLFIVLYMFRACHAHHQEKKILSIQLLLILTPCWWQCRVLVWSKLD